MQKSPYTIATPQNINKQRNGTNTTITGSGSIAYTNPKPTVPKTPTPNIIQSQTPSVPNQQPLSQTAVQQSAPTTPDEEISRAARDYISQNNLVGVRDRLVRNGINNDRIGWDGRNVTIDGAAQISPQYNDNGTAYDTEQMINQATQRAYAASGDELKAARDYIEGMGMGQQVEWDGNTGMVTIAGTPIKPAFVSPDGVAYIPKSQLDAASDNYRQRQGITTPQGVNEQYESRYGDYIDKALEKLINRERFDWTPQTDEAYQKHVQHQSELAEIAYRKVLNDNGVSASSASGAVLAAALAAKNNYLKALSEDEYNYREAAYNRYLDNINLQRDTFDAARTVANDFYNRAYTADSDSYARSRQATLDDRNYRMQIEQNNRANEEQQYKNDYNKIQNDILRITADYAPRNAEADARAKEAANDTAYFNYMKSIASERGYYTAEDEQWLPGLSRYREIDPNTGVWTGNYTISPWSSEAQYQYDMQKAAYRAANGL